MLLTSRILRLSRRLRRSASESTNCDPAVSPTEKRSPSIAEKTIPSTSARDHMVAIVVSILFACTP